MSEWKEYKLGDVATKIMSGGTPKSSVPTYYDGQIPWLNTKEVNFNRITRTERCISELGLENSSAKWIPKSAVIVAMYGATAGKVAFSKIDLTTNQACCNLIINEEKADAEFVYYALMSEYDRLTNLACGAAQQNLSVGVISDFFVLLPPIVEQKQIVGVLSSLDDKIDLLHRENATLEALAETLFRHYFIENPDPTWKEMPVSCYGKVICGKTPSKKNTEYFGGEVPFIKIPDMHGKTYVFNSEDSLSEEGKLSQKEKTLPKESIMVSCIATVGLVSMNAYEAQTNQQINSVVPYDEQYRYYLYCWFKSMYDELIAMASGGTATLNLNTGDFSRIGIPVPNETAIKEFHLQVEPLFAKIKSNQQQMQTLTTQRDSLLPRLMSGEVKVSGQ